MPDTTTDDREIDLRGYLAVLRRRKWVMVATTLLVVGLAVTASVLQTKTYKATAEVLLQPRASEQVFAPAQEQAQRSDRQAEVDTEIQVMKSRTVTSAAAEALGMPAHVSIAPKARTDVVAISARSSDPALAAKIANTYTESYIKTRRQQAIEDLLAVANQVQTKLDEIDARLSTLDSQAQTDPAAIAERQALFTQRATYSQQLSQLQLASNLTKSGGAQLVSRADAPTSPFQPKPVRSAALAFILSLVLGGGLAFLIDHLDDSLRSKEDLETASGLAVLGSIPVLGTWKNTKTAKLVTLGDPFSPPSEAYRGLRTSVQFLRIDAPVRAIQFTSATASEGKTTTVANLAVAIANAGHNVLVVCCDLRRPRVHELFGLSNRVGVTSVLIGDSSIADAVQATGIENLSLLASGPIPAGPSELLGSTRTADLIESLTGMWDTVLIDSPPVLPVSDALVLAGRVDATILVTASKRVTRRSIARAVDALRLVDAPLLGAVLNGTSAAPGYGYRSGYSYEPRSEPTRDEAEKARLVSVGNEGAANRTPPSAH